jgi:phosphomannomutase
MKLNPVIFREYDIRGVVNKDFDEAFAKALGQSLAVYIHEKFPSGTRTVAVGYDARLSSPSLSQAVVDGFTSSGYNVLKLGLVTTPISYFSTFHMPVDGAVMITGSHNPPEYNGFKISVGKSTIYGAEIQAVGQILSRGQFLSGSGKATDFDILSPYVARYEKEFKDLSSVKVVFDCGNGAAGSVARRMFTACGLNYELLFEQPDGNFPNHHPDPTVEENLDALKAKVKSSDAAVGIGFDGDADRIGVIDHTGRMIAGDELMVLISRSILQKTKGAKIIGDVKCSDRLYADISKHGGSPVMWKTGHSLIKQKIKDEHSPFGGELSGHIFFADRNFGYDDALYAGIRLVEIMAQTGKTIPQLLEGLPTAFNTPEIRIDTTEEKKLSIVKELQKRFEKPKPGITTNLIDGIRISYPDGWALARPSNTQPVLVLRFESSTGAGLKRIENEIRSVVDPLL